MSFCFAHMVLAAFGRDLVYLFIYQLGDHEMCDKFILKHLDKTSTSLHISGIL